MSILTESPVVSFSPEALRALCAEHCLDARELGKILGLKTDVAHAVLSGKQPLTDRDARRLSRRFSPSANA